MGKQPRMRPVTDNDDTMSTMQQLAQLAVGVLTALQQKTSKAGKSRHSMKWSLTHALLFSSYQVRYWASERFCLKASKQSTMTVTISRQRLMNQKPVIFNHRRVATRR